MMGVNLSKNIWSLKAQITWTLRSDRNFDLSQMLDFEKTQQVPLKYIH